MWSYVSTTDREGPLNCEMKLAGTKDSVNLPHERVPSALPVLRKHEKSYVLALERQHPQIVVHRIRDSKRFFFPYSDSNIARIENLNIRSIQPPHCTEKGCPEGKWLFKRDWLGSLQFCWEKCWRMGVDSSGLALLL